eukprot:gene28380-9624_t
MPSTGASPMGASGGFPLPQRRQSFTKDGVMSSPVRTSPRARRASGDTSEFSVRQLPPAARGAKSPVTPGPVSCPPLSGTIQSGAPDRSAKPQSFLQMVLSDPTLCTAGSECADIQLSDLMRDA